MKFEEHYIGFEVTGRAGFDRARMAIMQTMPITAGGIITRWQEDEPIYSIFITGSLLANELKLPLVAAEAACMAFDKYGIITTDRPWHKLPSYELSSSEFAHRKAMARS